MLLIDNQNISDPTVNLALEEYCYRHLSTREDYVLFYVNQPSIIIGNHQNPFQEFNYEFAQQHKLRPVRRISGGGAVYHDPGNLNFSFITPFSGEMLEYFKTLLQPILDTLKRLGVPAQLTEKNNIMVDGRKISGNSQHTDMRRMLSHGTLLFDADLAVLQHVLQSKLQIIQSRAVASVPSSVTNISNYLPRSMDINAFMAELIFGISSSFGGLGSCQLTAAEWKAVGRLSEEKYRSWEWTIGRSPEFTVIHKLAVDAAAVEVHMRVKHAIIEDIQIADYQDAPQMPYRKLVNQIGQRYDPSHPNLLN
jgi:lipoate-protein ligase A